MPKITVTETPLAGLVVIEPRVFRDARGFFVETFNRADFQELGLDADFVQDNQSRSAESTLRGLHFQIEHPQGKLVRAVRGKIFDVAVDLRPDSPSFAQWFGIELTEENAKQLYVPPGFGHGFCALTEGAEIIYKCTDFYSPTHDRTLLWNDPEIHVEWPIEEPLLSEKDLRGRTLAQLQPELQEHFQKLAPVYAGVTSELPMTGGDVNLRKRFPR